MRIFLKKCNACSQLINVRLLREHIQNCVSELPDSVHLNGGTMSTICSGSMPIEELTLEQPTTSYVPTYMLLPGSSVDEIASLEFVVQSQLETHET